MVVAIRPAVHEDLSGILAIERQAPSAPHWLHSDYQEIITLVGEPQRCLLVAKLGAEIVGFAVGKVVAGFGELESVVVAEPFERQGVGYQICHAALLWCQGAGATAIELEVRQSSQSAIRLYERLGFREEGRRPGYYRNPPEDAVLMRCTLPIRE